MAGDWMKIELELPDKPEVHYIAGIVNKDPQWVVGALITVWGWFNKHTVDGNALGVTFVTVDRYAGVSGFGEAMMLAGWLEQNGSTLTMPKFDRHTSESSKARALGAARTLKSRNKSNGECNGDSVTESLHGRQQEKRREDINTPAESGTDPIWGFGLDWLGGNSMRPFLGKQVSQYGADVVSAALDRCMAQGKVVDPKSYFLKLLEGEDKKPKAWVPGQKRDVRSYT